MELIQKIRDFYYKHKTAKMIGTGVAIMGAGELARNAASVFLNTPTVGEAVAGTNDTEKEDTNEGISERSAEIMGGNSYASLDSKLLETIAPNTAILIRNRNEVDYDNQVNNSLILDLGYNFHGGFDIMTELQAATGTGFVPRVGLQYLKEGDNYKLVGLGHFGLTNGNHNGEFVLDFKYNPELSRYLPNHLAFEAITNVGEEGINLYILRPRIGKKVGKWTLSIGADINNLGEEPAHDNYGASVQREF